MDYCDFLNIFVAVCKRAIYTYNMPLRHVYPVQVLANVSDVAISCSVPTRRDFGWLFINEFRKNCASLFQPPPSSYNYNRILYTYYREYTIKIVMKCVLFTYHPFQTPDRSNPIFYPFFVNSYSVDFSNHIK